MPQLLSLSAITNKPLGADAALSCLRNICEKLLCSSSQQVLQVLSLCTCHDYMYLQAQVRKAKSWTVLTELVTTTSAPSSMHQPLLTGQEMLWMKLVLLQHAGSLSAHIHLLVACLLFSTIAMSLGLLSAEILVSALLLTVCTALCAKPQ